MRRKLIAIMMALALFVPVAVTYDPAPAPVQAAWVVKKDLDQKNFNKWCANGVKMTMVIQNRSQSWHDVLERYMWYKDQNGYVHSVRWSTDKRVAPRSTLYMTINTGYNQVFWVDGWYKTYWSQTYTQSAWLTIGCR